MDCVVIKPFHFKRDRLEPSADPAKPRVVSLDLEQYARLRDLGCVEVLEEHQTKREAEKDIASFRTEAEASASQAAAKALADAKAKADAARASAESEAAQERPAPQKHKRAPRPR
jgi:hypothetical protein